jgi:hypothetical protein
VPDKGIRIELLLGVNVGGTTIMRDAVSYTERNDAKLISGTYGAAAQQLVGVVQKMLADSYSPLGD